MKSLRLTFGLATLCLAGWCLAQDGPPADAPAAGNAVNGAATAGLAVTPPASQPAARVGARISSAPRTMPINAAQREQVLGFLAAEQPDLFEKLQEVKTKDAARYAVMLQQVGPSTLYLIELKKGNPELYSLYLDEMKAKRETQRLGDAARSAADPSAKSKLVNQLRQELTRLFEISQERQRLQLSQFTKDVERLDAMLRTRLANKNKIIESQLQRILQPAANSAGLAGQAVADPTPAPKAGANAVPVPASRPD